MSRSIHVEVESSARVEHVLAAFGDDAYWRARLATFGNGTATLDALQVDASNTVTVTITLNLLPDRLPRLITQLHAGDLEMVRSERWSLAADGRVHGDLTAGMPAAPLSMVGEALLAPADSGSRLEYDASVDVRIPIGRRENRELYRRPGRQRDRCDTTLHHDVDRRKLLMRGDASGLRPCDWAKAG